MEIHVFSDSVHFCLASPDSCLVKMVECPTCFISFPVEDIVEHADMCAAWYVESDDGVTASDAIVLDGNYSSDTNDNELGDTEGPSFISLITQLQNNLEPSDPIRINVRRKTLWEDFLGQRRRRVKPQRKLKVVFLGEPAIDDGGPHRGPFQAL